MQALQHCNMYACSDAYHKASRFLPHSCHRHQLPHLRWHSSSLLSGLSSPDAHNKTCTEKVYIPRYITRAFKSASRTLEPTDEEWQGVVAIAAGSALFCNLQRSTFSVLTPCLQQQFSLSLSEVSMLQTAMLAAYLLGQLPSGRLADKLGGARVLLFGLALWSLATAACSAAGTAAVAAPIALVAASRLLFGISSACLMPAVSATASLWVPLARKASSISFIYACFNVGGVAGFVIMPVLAELLGWPVAFLAAGALGLAWSAGTGVWLAWLHEGARDRAARRQGKQQQDAGSSSNSSSGGSLEQAGLDASSAGAASVQQQDTSAAGPSTASSTAAAQQQEQQSAAKAGFHLGPLHVPVTPAVAGHIAVLCWAHAVMGWGYFIMANWIPMYITSLGEGRLASMGLLSSLPSLSAAVFGLMSASIADKLIEGGLPVVFVRRLFHTLTTLGFAAAVAPLALISSPSVPLATACLTLASALYACSFGGFHAYLQDVVDKDVGIGLVQGLTNSCSIALGIGGNLCTGWLVDSTGSFSAVFALTCALCISSCLLWLGFAKGQRVSLAA